MKKVLKKFFGKEKTINIGWILSTSDESVISEYFEEDNGREPNDDDWDIINESISKFYSQYKGIVGVFGSNPREYGYNGDDDLVGDVTVKIEDLITILETGEDVGNGEIVLTSSSGRLCIEQLDLLPNCVYVSLTFLLPEELYEIL